MLVPRLAERGHEVEVVDLLWFGNHLPADIPVYQKDIFELDEHDLAGYDQVIFLGGLSNDPMAEFSPALNFIYNAAAPAYLAYLAMRAGVRRYIYASSCSVYGYTRGEPYPEDAPIYCTYPYGISKLQGERAVLQLASETFSVICLRKGTVSGYSPRMRLDLIVNTMFKTALENGRIVINNPYIWRPIVGMEDAVQAYLLAVEAHPDLSGVFNIASGNWTVKEVALMVKDALEDLLGLKIELEEKHIPDKRNYLADTRRARALLGFRPTQSIPDIVRDLLNNYEKFKDFDNPLYYNIRVFKSLNLSLPRKQPTLR